MRRTISDSLNVCSLFIVPLSFSTCASGSVSLLPNALRSFSPEVITDLRIPENILNAGAGTGAGALADAECTDACSCFG